MQGKLDPMLLEKIFEEYSGVLYGEDILVPPSIGEDAGVVSMKDDKVLVVHSDPITGASSRIGWLAVHVPANDIAVTGVRPKWFTLVLLLPLGSSEKTVEEIMRDASKALGGIGAKLLGGHTEITDSVNRTVISSTAIGIGKRGFLTLTQNAKPGEKIIMTKTAGLEAAAIAASDLEERLSTCMDSGDIQKAKAFIEHLSLVEEALILAEKGIASSMHDPTEGGVLEALYEIAYASKTTVVVEVDKILVNPLANRILGCLGIDPLRSLSSGSLIASVPDNKVDEALGLLEGLGVEASVIGWVREKGKPAVILRGTEGESTILDSWIKDDFIRKYPSLLGG